jgi:hypothetical protein
MPKLVTTQTNYQTFTHRVLWECVKSQIEKAKEKPDGSFYFWLSAMVMGYMVFEAYLNYVGEALAPVEWDDEKEFFSKPPYKGSQGKLLFLLNRYQIDSFDKSTRPFNSVFALKSIRDEIAYAKPHHEAQSVTHPSTVIAPFTRPWLQNRVNEKEATRLLVDLETFINTIHQSFKGCKDGSKLLIEHPLNGLLGFGIGQTIPQ